MTRFPVALILGAMLWTCPTLASDGQASGDLTIHVTGIRNTSGCIVIALTDSEKSFLGKGPACAQIRTRIHGPEVMVTLRGLPWKEYAISVFHDENANGTLDRNMKGIPKEAYGYSNNVRGKHGPPSYGMSRFSFHSQTQTVMISIH